MTDLNTLKNWFRTGLKPTQEQFAAWMDSYFHKSEKIPQSQIEGLDTTLQNKADADQLKNKADLVGGKIPLAQMPFADDVLEFSARANFPAQGEAGKIYLDLAADKPFLWDVETADYKAAGGDDVRMAQIEQGLAGKVDKPTSDGNWIFSKLGSVFSWIDATNFGKNIANSPLISTIGASFTLGFDYVINTAGKLFKISNLISAQGDATFTKRLKVRSDGTLGIVDEAVARKEDLVAMPVLFNEAERTAWKTQMNGGWTTNTMSVSAIIPPIIEKDLSNPDNNKNINISLEGANLNLPPSNFLIKICTSNSTPENYTVLQTIDNSKVTLLNANYLNFFLDINNYEGEFKILLNNGVATYLTDTFIISSNVEHVLLNVPFLDKVKGDVSTDKMDVLPNGFRFKGDANVAPLAFNSEIIYKAKTQNPLFLSGENFYLESYLSLENYLGRDTDYMMFGLSTTNEVNSLINDFIGFFHYYFGGGANAYISGFPLTMYNGNQVIRCVMMKKGNTLIKRITGDLGFNEGVKSYQTMQSLPPNTDFYFGGLATTVDNASKGFSVTNVKAYKF